MKKSFHKPCVFPNEAFVQQALETHFESAGYQIDAEEQIDLVAWKSEKDKWMIEAKGHTSSDRVDFNTGLGQLIGHMENDTDKYALAIPRVAPCIKQSQNLSAYIRAKLQLIIIIVNQDGHLEFFRPDQTIE
jgi:hypothetical protein